MRRLLLDATVLEDSEAPTVPPATPVLTITPLQWAYSQVTQPETEMPWLGIGTTGGAKLSVLSEAFPYTVPAGCYLAVKGAGFACKISNPASYLVITNGFSVSGTAPALTFPQPFLYPSGAQINALFINNSMWQQNMAMWLQAELIEGVPAEWTYRDVLRAIR